MNDIIYLDYNATTPVAPEVAAAMRPFLEGFYGNPSSSHPLGIAARQAVEQARAQLAALLGCQADEVVFTSGGSEANNTAIKGSALTLRERGRHIITSAIEHPAVTEVCRFLETEGFRVTYLPVGDDGLVDPGSVEQAISADTILITVMHANNEVGTIQPLAEIAAIARERGIRFHSMVCRAWWDDICSLVKPVLFSIYHDLTLGWDNGNFSEICSYLTIETLRP